MEVSDQLHEPVALSLGKRLLVLIGQEARWAPDSLEAVAKRKNSVPARNRIPVVEPFALSLY
jgi:hypothetical protein